MGVEIFSAVKSKINDFVSSFRKKNSSLPAVAVLVLVVITLVVFEIVDMVDNPTSQRVNPIKTSQLAETKSKSIGSLHDQLTKIMSATKKTSFRAKVITNEGFKEYWTQSGRNCRFEDPSRQNIIILNYSKKKLWMVNLAEKTASEVALDTSTADFYAQITPVLLLGGLTNTSTAQTIKLGDVLPSNRGSKLTFTKEGLPRRWEGFKSNNSASFVDWQYIQVNKSIPASEFELPQGITSQN